MLRVQLIYMPPPRDDYAFWDDDTYQEGDPKGFGANPLIAHLDYTVQTEGLTAAFVQADQLMAYVEELMKNTPIVDDEMPASNSLGAAGRGSRRDGTHPLPQTEGPPIAPNPSFSEAFELEAALRAIGMDRP
jgi:hypothetical protein